MRQSGIRNKTVTATPRQLESLIRLSESLARMRLSDVVEASDVGEAVRLMTAATLQVRAKRRRPHAAAHAAHAAHAALNMLHATSRARVARLHLSSAEPGFVSAGARRRLRPTRRRERSTWT